MTRFARTIDLVTGDETPVPFTPEEEAAADAYVPPDPAVVDQGTLNAALSAEGSVFRALALVLLQEINTIRTKLPTPLPTYTQAQLVAALKAKMR
jgi:hypothetical protein